MTTSEIYKKYAEDIMQGFIKFRGRGSCYCLFPLKPYDLIAKCINAYFNKHTEQILIVVDNYSTRTKILDTIKELFDKEFNIKILSSQYINPKYHYTYKYIITCNVNDNVILKKLYDESTFTLAIFTEVITNQVIIQYIRQFLPNITSDVSISDLRSSLIYSPVEEYQIGVNLIDEDLEKYNKCTEFINQSVSIFGDIKNIEKCKRGIPELNITANEFRTELAKENGWSETLDTNIELFAKIDQIYNPNILFERACTFYNITAERRNILCNNINKIDKIIDICNNNSDKRILILSKKGEFAAAITEAINNRTSLKCLDYHDCIEDAMLVDDMGVPILHKSGANKGKPRIIKATAISNRNLNEFNSKHANVLSVKYSSESSIKTNVDIVIITDGLHDNIVDIKTRYSKIDFNENPTICYRLYTYDTIEEKQLNAGYMHKNIKVIKEERDVIYDEDTGNVII